MGCDTMFAQATAKETQKISVPASGVTQETMRLAYQGTQIEYV